MTYQLNTSKGPINVRPAIIDDAVLLRELRLEALTNEPASFSADLSAAQEDPAEIWVETIKSYALENKGIISVACNADRLVGMTGLARGNRPKTCHNGTIWGVYVNPDWRGMKVGEALVKECLSWALVQGLVVVKLGVITTNTAAVRCYARCGFSVYGVEPKTICYEGVYYDELLMSKPI